MGGDQRETDLSWLLQVRVHLAERTNKKKAPRRRGLGSTDGMNAIKRVQSRFFAGNRWRHRLQTDQRANFCRAARQPPGGGHRQGSSHC